MLSEVVAHSGQHIMSYFAAKKNWGMEFSEGGIGGVNTTIPPDITAKLYIRCVT